MFTYLFPPPRPPPVTTPTERIGCSFLLFFFTSPLSKRRVGRKPHSAYRVSDKINFHWTAKWVYFLALQSKKLWLYKWPCERKITCLLTSSPILMLCGRLLRSRRDAGYSCTDSVRGVTAESCRRAPRPLLFVRVIYLRAALLLVALIQLALWLVPDRPALSQPGYQRMRLAACQLGLTVVVLNIDFYLCNGSCLFCVLACSFWFFFN